MESCRNNIDGIYTAGYNEISPSRHDNRGIDIYSIKGNAAIVWIRIMLTE